MSGSNDNWTIEDAINIYQIDRWGDQYYSVNKDGNLCVLPKKSHQGPVINISDVIEEVKKESIALPVVVRFHDILRDKVHEINKQFAKTISDASYQGEYYGVFPIKVNQLREVIEEVTCAGSDYNYGLEAGSKSELLTVLAYNTNPNSLTILNGYKDREYMELAILGTQIGKKMVVVIEKFSEIFLLLDVIEKTNIEPIIGVRAKLSSKGTGKWADSSGQFAKFGLTISEILELVKLLKEKDKLHLLNLFHFHIGSQIPDIRDFKESINEGVRIYCDLKKLGAPIEFFDVGGGVGINYDGSRSNCPSSTNYTLKDYVADVVYILKDICDETKTEHPHIVTETGRAISAHHSCVITNVFGSVEMNAHTKVNTTQDDDDHLLLKNMKALHRDLNVSNYQDIFNDASIYKEEAISAFKLGIISLVVRSKIENLHSNLCQQIIDMTVNEKYVPLEISNLKFTYADQYLCNFSVFQSVPDSWAINQILPVVPIQRLSERPTKEVTLQDITCDSDGKINSFLGPDGHRPTLPLHPLNKDEEYYIGIFLTGAYQDIMGDMHNMFGRLNEVHVFSDNDDPTNFYIEEIIHGQSAGDVLQIMQYSPTEMCKKIKFEIDKNIKNGKLKARQGVKLADFYEESIKGYTYLEKF